MKITIFRLGLRGVACGILVALAGSNLVAQTTDSKFTYQGQLNVGASAAAGSYDLHFSLFDSASNGAQIGVAITNAAVAITNGLFTVPLDFGGAALTGQPRWLEIAVRTSTNEFQILTPRQPLTPTPYAISAYHLSGVVDDTQLPAGIARLGATQTFSGAIQLTNSANALAGNFFGNGAGLTNLNLDTSVLTNWVLAQGYQITNGIVRKPIVTPAPISGTNYIVDFLNEVVAISATNTLNFLQSTNRPAAGWHGETVWYIHGGAANRTLRFNTNWTGVGTLAANVPLLIPANKLTLIALSASGENETNVTYAISRQE